VVPWRSSPTRSTRTYLVPRELETWSTITWFAAIMEDLND
jgi:hypothetical protein